MVRAALFFRFRLPTNEPKPSLFSHLAGCIWAHPIKGVGGEVEDHSKASGLELR
jgi:hypothetical protein